MKKVTTAFVLGAGLGTRLRPYTQDTPKPLLSVQGKPILFHTLDRLIEYGIERIIINTHHCPEKYAQAFPNSQYRNVPLTLRYEPELLDTAGGLKNIEDLIPPENPLLIYNGDILSTLPLSSLSAFHFSRESEVTLALRTSGEPRNVLLSKDGWIGDFRQTLHPQQPGNTLYSGICVIEPRFLKRLIPGKKISLVPIWLDMIRQNRPPAGIILDKGTWNDIGTVALYEKINSLPS